MSELYTVTAEEGRLRFLPRTDAALEQAVLDESPLPGCELVCPPGRSRAAALRGLPS